MAHRTRRGEPSRWLEEHLAAAPPDECVEWPFGGVRGYGMMRDAGRMRMVTHVVLERTGRPRPPAPEDNALHACDNPPCVNPTHLRWGTDAANATDKARRGRSVGHPGEAHGRSVLTEADVRAIRARYAAGGVSQRALAKEYGVGRSTVADVVNYRKWTHL